MYSVLVSSDWSSIKITRAIDMSLIKIQPRMSRMSTAAAAVVRSHPLECATNAPSRLWLMPGHVLPLTSFRHRRRNSDQFKAQGPSSKHHQAWKEVNLRIDQRLATSSSKNNSLQRRWRRCRLQWKSNLDSKRTTWLWIAYLTVYYVMQREYQLQYNGSGWQTVNAAIVIRPCKNLNIFSNRSYELS